MLILYVTLYLDFWLVDLESSWDNKRHVIKVLSELLISLQISAHIMSRFDLDLWPVDLELL